MFCPKCGTNCGDAKFCPECGVDLHNFSSSTSQSKHEALPPLREPYYVEINGKRMDLNKVIRIYGTGFRRCGAYSYLQTECDISSQKAKEILDPIYAAHAGEKVSFFDGANAQLQIDQDKIQQEKNDVQKMDDEGQIYCPKCHSTSISAQKKGFGFVRGAVGAAVGLDVGLIAGGAGANKIKLVCMKCGYEWKPGKK